MNYQNFAIIFVIIMLPISIALSYYIQTQTDTITLQTEYQNKLSDSTYDAIVAYQMNSMNTQSVSGESVKSYVLASVNTFFTTLAANLGMSSASKSAVLSYVPAVLFTTYDGYYIYSPTKTPTVVTDSTGVAVTTSDGYVVYYKNKVYTEASTKEIENIQENPKSQLDDTLYTTDESEAESIEYSYMLKPFIYYSAEYQDSDYDFVASYTLDNYVTLYGTRSESMAADDSKIDGYTNEFTKSGYLIDSDKIELKGDLLIKTATRREDNEGNEIATSAMPGTYEEIIDSNKDDDSTSKDNVRYVTVDITDPEAYNYINYYYFGENSKSYTYNGRTYYPAQLTDGTELRFQTGDEMIESTFEIEEMIQSESLSKNDVNAYLLLDSSYDPITVSYNGIEITDIEAKEYYVKAYFFSLWVKNNLSSVKEETVVQKSITGDTANADAYEHFSGEAKIFNIGDDNDPESEDSAYYNHKRKVIKNSIQYNLNVAISTYNYNYGIDLASDETANSYNMPILTETDWDSILNNVCMVSFLQGLATGSTTFNGYAVVKSSNNNTSVSIENMYFTEEIGESSQGSEYHKYDCPELGNTTSVDDTIYEADLSAEFKYDAHKINSKVDDDDNIIAYYDDSTNTYYEVTAERSNWRKNTTE